MDKKKEEPEKLVKDFAIDAFAEFVRDTCVKSFKLPISLWEENLKSLNTQIEQWISFQKDYMDVIEERYNKVPSWNANLLDTEGYFKYPLALHKTYLDSVKSTLNDITKKNLDLLQKNIETASSLFDTYFNLFKVNK